MKRANSVTLGGSNRGVKSNTINNSLLGGGSYRGGGNNNNNSSSVERVLLPAMFLVALGLLLFVAFGIVLLNVHVLMSTNLFSTNHNRNDCNSTSAFSSPVQLLLNNKLSYQRWNSNGNQQQHDMVQSCIDQTYGYMKQNQTIGLTDSDYERSRSHIGDRKRLSYLVHDLLSKKRPLTVLVCGGSISLGHGVEPGSARYSDQLEVYLNTYFPLSEDSTSGVDNNPKHRVYNKGSHGADMCAMAKRINTMEIPPDPDLFVLEFAVNDYQGQDHKVHIDHKTDIFFEGFQRLALCAEVVVYKLLTQYPKASIIFLEFQTAILNRKNAQLLHMGVAQHYDIPVVSYANTMFKPYYNLIQKLDSNLLYSAPINDSLQPYPHGCSPCMLESITEDFRPFGCKSVCTFMNRSDYECDFKAPVPKGRQPCYTSFLSHDAVHPSAVGHQIARDLIIQAIADTAKDMCLKDQKKSITSNNLLGRTEEYYDSQYIPDQYGWLAPPDTLKLYSEFVFVKDTMEMFAKQDPLLSKNHSRNFQIAGDGGIERKGWMCTTIHGGEYVEFIVDLPTNECYVVYIAALKSYENMGMFTVELIDLINPNTVTAKLVVDGIWEPRISIPSDIPINIDNDDDTAESSSSSSQPVACSGKCIVRVTTHPQIQGRSGNKVKIMTLSARKCTRKVGRSKRFQPHNNVTWLML